MNGGKEKMRKTKVQEKYGITMEQYEQMFVAQGGLCAICGKPERQKIGNVIRGLSIDHDHKTNKIRELLCHRCNVSIGLMGESVDVLASSIRYLTKHM